MYATKYFYLLSTKLHLQAKLADIPCPLTDMAVSILANCGTHSLSNVPDQGSTPYQLPTAIHP